MAFSKKRKPALEDDLNLLIGDLCSQWGFCNRLSADDIVVAGQTLSADKFAEAVFRAEGMNPEYELEWRRRIGRLFKDRYGNSISPEEYCS